MNQYYNCKIFWSDEDNCFIAKSVVFDKVTAFGDSTIEAVIQLVIIVDCVIKIYQENNWELPIVKKE